MPTRRVLKSVAHNLADALLGGPYILSDGSVFTHLEAAAHRLSLTAVTLDLMEGRAQPEPATTPALRELAALAGERLQELIAGVGLPPAVVTAARLEAELVRGGIMASTAADQALRLDTVRLVLQDDLGHSHAFVYPKKWFGAADV
jgi:hypothetical protein